MKKAQITLYYPIWILRIVFMAAVIVSLGVVTGNYISARVDISQPQANALNYRILFDDLLLYRDKYTNRVYPLVYDSAALGMSQEDFERKISARIGYDPTISFAGAVLSLKGDRIDKTYSFNKPAFDRLQALSQTLFGESTHTTTIYPVIVRDSSGLKPATLKLEVYMQK